MVPRPRLQFTIVESLDDGYRLRPGDGSPFFVSELGSRFLLYIDGRRSIGEIAELVKRAMLTDPDELLTAAKNEQEQGRTLDSFLLQEALAFIRATTDFGALTFEPSTSGLGE